VGACKNGNEFLGSIKGWEILDQLSDYQLLNKASALLHWLVSDSEIMKFLSMCE
jgi:hypothetical protein